MDQWAHWAASWPGAAPCQACQLGLALVTVPAAVHCAHTGALKIA